MAYGNYQNGYQMPIYGQQVYPQMQAQTPASVPTITREEYDALGAKINELTEKVNKLEAKEAEI